MKLTLLPVTILFGIAALGQGHLKTSENSQLKLNNGATLVISDLNFLNNGSFSQSGNSDVLEFSGSTTVNIDGTGTFNIENMRVSKSGAANVTLLQSLTISNQVQFGSGLLNLGNSILTLGSGANLSGETESARAITSGTGYIEVQANLNAPVSANPGNLGAVISSAQDLGQVTIRRGHVSQTNSFGNGNSILRYYDITPANNTALDATLRFNYLDAELNGLTENSLVLWKSEDNAYWSHEGYTSRDGSANYVEKTGISSFSRWTLSSLGNTLPVTITRFEGVMAGTAVKLSWDVEFEVDMQAYVVERSGDGHSFTGVGTVAALNAPGAHRYEFTDPVAGLTSKIYYRLRQVNFDGTYRNSKIIWLTTGKAFKVQVYPNPTSGDVSLYVSSETNTDITINLRNALGNLVYRRTAKVSRGGNVFSLATTGLQKGVYYLELTSAHQQHKTSLLVQ